MFNLFYQFQCVVKFCCYGCTKFIFFQETLKEKKLNNKYLTIKTLKGNILIYIQSLSEVDGSHRGLQHSK